MTTPIYADYAVDTQRKDKFNLSLSLTKEQVRNKKTSPFFSFYNKNYGPTIHPSAWILYRVFSDVYSDFSSLGLAATKRQNSFFNKFSLAFARKLALEKTSSGFTVDLYLGRAIIEQGTGNNREAFNEMLSCIFRVPRSFKAGESEPDIQQNPDGTQTLNENAPVNVKKEKGPRHWYRDYFVNSQNNLLSALAERAGAPADAVSWTLTIKGSDLVASALNSTKDIRCLNGIDYITIERQGDALSFYMTLSMSKEDAESMTGISDFVAIRNIDIYPMLSAWASKNYQNGPTVSIALSRISKGLDPTHINYAKTNEHNLLLTGKGSILYIPRQLDKTRDYEDAYIASCTAEGSNKFSLENSEKSGKNLPKNMPILVDWTNNKFAYTNISGQIVILDLSQCRPLTASHVVNVFKRKMWTANDIYRFVSYAAYTQVNVQKYVDMTQRPLDAYFATACAKLFAKDKVSVFDVCNNEAFVPIVQFLCELGTSIEKNPSEFFSHVAVSTMISEIGLLLAIANYAQDSNTWESTKDDDDKEKAPAVNQGVSPDWELPSIPLFMKGGYVMPHQKRVMNKLKDDPKFALIPVAAGGGKTVIAIADLLYHYKEGKAAPYIILCPKPLVSQYIQEISFFTSARLNAIPITSSVVKREGMERLQAIFNSAPRNTVVVCDYDALKYNAHSIAYGTDEITQYPVVMFLRQFGFGYALCDESHFLKNESSARSNAVRSLLSDIPRIRLASGTMAYNQVKDFVGQAGIMDPSIFGDEKSFMEMFNERDDNDKVTDKLRPGAELEIQKKLAGNMVIAGAERKEWAALLPQAKTYYHLVELSPEEQDIYDEMIKEAQEKMESNPTIQKQLAKLQEMRNSNEDPDIIAQAEEALGRQLDVYLQKIERSLFDFSGNSGVVDQSGSGAFFVTSKAKAIINILRAHIYGTEKNPVPTVGKCLIFCQNIASAEAIFKAANTDAGLKGTGILYVASKKSELVNKFNTDEKVKWMVGVETSINTGLNLQSASRIIRAEYPWVPGAIEQGNARILRPQLKSKETRKEVYFDWVMCDGTIDSLKVSRLMAKSVQIAKFENPKDPRYQEIGTIEDMETGELRSTIPMISISLKNIRANLKFAVATPDGKKAAGELYEYFTSMQKLNTLMVQNFDEYREAHQDEVNPDGTMKVVHFTNEPNPKDAKLLKRIPYVEGMNMYKAQDLGLVRLDEYLNQVITDATDNEDNSDDDVDNILEDTIQDLKYESVWTEYGECKLLRISSSANSCTVRPVGTNDSIKVPKNATFVITKRNIGGQKLQEAILKATGLKSYATPDDVRPAEFKQITRNVVDEEDEQLEQENLRREADLTVSLSPISINGIFGLRFNYEEGHELAINVLQQEGFGKIQSHYRAMIKNHTMLETWIDKVLEAGYSFERRYDYAGAWVAISRALQTSLRVANGDMFKASTKFITKITTTNDIKNMTVWNPKPTTKEDVLRVQPMFSNGVVFAVMPNDALYSAGKELRKIRVPGLRWAPGPEGYEKFFTQPKRALAFIRRLVKEGLNIANFKELEKTIKNLRPTKFLDIDEVKVAREKAKKQKKRKVNLRDALKR